MAPGGCFCGKIRIEYNGEPITAGLCHCADCRKLTGSLYSYSLVVKSADLKITGTPKAVAKTSDSGNHIENYFCPDCGTPLYGTNSAKALEGVTVLRGGVFDDLEVLNQNEPKAELFIGGRVTWVSPVEGTVQCVGMLPLTADQASS